MEFASALSRRQLAAVAAGSAIAGAAGPAAAATASSTRVPADDKLAIIELMALYAWAYDTGDVAAFARTFTPGGVMEVFGNVMAKGREQMPAFLATAFEMRKDNGWQHLTDHHVFRDYDGRRCTVYSYYLMPESDAAGGNVHLRAMGYYVSECVKNGDEWLFAKRSVVRWNTRKPWRD